MGVLLNPAAGQFQPVDRLVSAAPRVLQPGHATQFVNKILLDDSLVKEINSGQKDPRDISIPVSILRFHVDVCKLCVVNRLEFRMWSQNLYPCI